MRRGIVSAGTVAVLLAGCLPVSETFTPVVPQCRAASQPWGGLRAVTRRQSRVLLRAAGTDSELRDEFSQLLSESGRDLGMKEMKAPKGSLEWSRQQQGATSAEAPAKGPAAKAQDATASLAAKASGGPALAGPPAKPAKAEAPAPSYAEFDALMSGKTPAPSPEVPEAVEPAERPAYAVYADGVGPTAAEKPLRPEVGEAALPPTLKTDMALTMFQMADLDASESLNLAEFEDLIHSVEPDCSSETIQSLYESIVCDDDSCQESISFLGFYRWLNKGNAETGSLSQKLVRQNYLFQAQLLFQEADTDGSGSIDAAELKVLGDALGLKWTRHDAKEVLLGLDKDGNGTIDFDEFFDWFCSQTAARDKAGAFGSQLRLMLRAHGMEQRQVLITGFPFKATADGAQRFFERCGKISNVKMLPWAKTGKPSGRFLIEFEELEGAQAALQMHKKKMGPRDIGVFRINVGDSEETMTIARGLHSAILGPQGSFLKSMEVESGARIFLRYDPSQLESNSMLSGSDERGRKVILKGTPKERETAKRLILEATQDGVATEAVTIESKYRDVLLARKGRNLRRVEMISGAKVFVPKVLADNSKSLFAVKKSEVKAADKTVLQVTGVVSQRVTAKAALEELTRTWTEVVHPMPAKFHGTMKGKGAIVVQRVEQETGATVTFSKDEGGFVIIAGQTHACDQAWTLMQFCKEKLPVLLTKLRSGAVKAGDFASVPFLEGEIDAEMVWPIALEEALMMCKKERRMF